MKPNQYYIDNIKLFVNEYFPGTPHVLLTGSFNTPFFNESSDLDIILISNWHRDSFVESYDYNGLKMQVIGLPLYDIDGVIYRDVAKGRGAIISMLAKGLILRDRNHLLRHLKQQCSTLYERGPMPARKEVIDRLRTRTTSCIEDIEGTDSFEEQVFTTLNAYNTVLKLFLFKKGLWDYEGKSASREIKCKDEDFHKQYISSLESFFQSHDKTKVLGFLKRTLLHCGGELHFGSTRNYKEVCNESRLTVHIQPCSKDTECKELRILTEKFCSFLYKHIKDIQCLSFIYPANGLYPPGAYIIIEAGQYTFDEYILPKIRLFHLKNPDSVHSGLLDNWQYPLNISPIETFGGDEIQEKVSKCLCNIHRMYKQNIFDALLTEDIQKVTYILEHYECLASLQEKGEWTNFWNMIFDIYIKTHLNKMLPTSNLEYIAEIKRVAILKEYESSYKDKRTVLPLHTELSTLLSEIEQYYIDNGSCLNTASYSGFYSTQKEQLFYVFFKLTDIILDMFFITEKALVTYIVMKK